MLLSVVASAAAICTRDDVPDADYVVPDDPALVDLLGVGDCLGTLVAPSHLLTVAHCAEHLDPGDALASGGHVVAEVFLHPDWERFPNDVALVRLAEPVVGVDPVPLYRDTDELGRTLTLYGRGLHATGLEGERGATDDGLLRRATNVVTHASEQWLEVAFEAPGDPGVLPLEGVGAGGDSGGPAFLETPDGRAIAGLNSWGDARPYRDVGKYGAFDYATRVSSFTDWIDGVAGTSPTGEPSRRRRVDGGCGCEQGGSSGSLASLLALVAVASRRGPRPRVNRSRVEQHPGSEAR